MAGQVWPVPLSVHSDGLSFAFAAAMALTVVPGTANAQPLNANPVMILDEVNVRTLKDMQTEWANIIYPDPSNPEHASQPLTGRNFHWDGGKKQWVDSQTGQGFGVAGYVVSAAPSATNPVIIEEPRTVGTATGAQEEWPALLYPVPSDPERATQPVTGSSFHIDVDTKHWVDSQTGQSFPVIGYLSLAPLPTRQNSDREAQIVRNLPFVDTALPAPPRVSTAYSFLFELGGFGGASSINGHTVGTAGLDGAVLFPLGNHVLIGPAAGFQWVDKSIVQTAGSRQPGSTFIDTSAWFNQVNLGARVEYNFSLGLSVGVDAGVTIASSKITQQLGFCGLGNATSPAGCTIFNTVKTHDTVTGPYVGGYISHSIFPHVGIFAGYDYYFGLKDTQANPTNPSGPRTTVFDLHYSTVKAGFLFDIGPPRATLTEIRERMR